MIKIATLGPKNTFSELAAIEYQQKIRNNKNTFNSRDSQICLFPSIKKVFKAVNTDFDLGIVPIENMLDGYVQSVLDLLLHSNLQIINELVLPIQFAFVANCHELSSVEKIYAQFVTQGQCSDFIEQFNNVSIVTTDSNGTSYRLVKNGTKKDGAIISIHSLQNGNFPLNLKNIEDFHNNQTRFIVIGKQNAEYLPDKIYKTSIVVINGEDRPGVLYNILQVFADEKINMVSIMSRPTKEILGKYHFFIDIEGHLNDPCVKKSLEIITESKYNIKILGSYPEVEKW